jgi:hypothetical protein
MAPPFSGFRFSPFGLPIPLPRPTGSDEFIPEIPMPPVPDYLRYGWLVARLAQQSLKDRAIVDGHDLSLLRDLPNSNHGSMGPAPGTGGEKPPHQPPSLPAGLLGLILKYQQMRQSGSNDENASLSSSPNQETRELVRVPNVTPFISKGRARNKSASGGSGLGNNGGKRTGGGDDDDYCMRRKNEEEGECHQRWRDGEFAHPDHYNGCKNRAVIRWDLCNRNGGRPSPSEPPRWRLDPDEEVYRNQDR